MDQSKAQTPEQRKAAPLLASCVIFLVALNLRPAIVAVGPLLSSIGTTFGWGESLQGLLGSLPLLAFALFSMIVGALTAKPDSNKVLLWALIALAGGCIVRSLSGESMVWLGTLVIGASIAAGNVLAPAIVKRDFIDSVSFATGAYSACVTAGSALAGLTASAAGNPHWRSGQFPHYLQHSCGCCAQNSLGTLKAIRLAKRTALAKRT